MKEIKTNNVPVYSWAEHVPFPDNAKEQLIATAELPIVFKQVCAMADVHYGMGCAVGSVIATKKAVIPASVGVDIGCGMMAQRLSINARDLPDNLSSMRSGIEKVIPVGFGKRMLGAPRGHNISPICRAWSTKLSDGFYSICQKYPNFQKSNNSCHVGTLGGGNHFIELCLDERGGVWVMLHSGSRGIGNAIGRFFIEKAKETMIKKNISVSSPDLSYLHEDDEFFKDYMQALEWAQLFAHVNRECMMELVLESLEIELGRNFSCSMPVVSCHHNYVSKEIHYDEEVYITRKGAVSAKEGELGIIPGSMGNKSFIVRGLGNKKSFHSCSHGAGRVMSRTQAKKEVSMEQHLKDLAGVECKKDASVLDETPRAYKNIDDVMRSQEDLVEIKHTLKQILCVKG